MIADEVTRHEVRTARDELGALLRSSRALEGRVALEILRKRGLRDAATVTEYESSALRSLAEEKDADSMSAAAMLAASDHARADLEQRLVACEARMQRAEQERDALAVELEAARHEAHALMQEAAASVEAEVHAAAALFESEQRVAAAVAHAAMSVDSMDRMVAESQARLDESTRYWAGMVATMEAARDVAEARAAAAEKLAAKVLEGPTGDGGAQAAAAAAAAADDAKEDAQKRSDAQLAALKAEHALMEKQLHARVEELVEAQLPARCRAALEAS